jgi:type IV pilus assembly protein PilC
LAEQDNITVRDAPPPDLATAADLASGKPAWSRWLLGRRTEHVSQKALAVFWRQLALLVEVGVPLLRALYQTAERTSHPAMGRAIRQVAAHIEAGNSLSEALARYPQVFSRLTGQIIQVAERGGVLDDSLRLVADELERAVEIRGKIRRALFYPALIIAVGVVVTLFVLTWVIPEFASLFREQQMALPLPTRIILGGASFLAGYWWLCLLVLMALGGLFSRYVQTPQGRLTWDRCKLSIPFVGDLLIKANVLRFAQTFGMLLRGGVPILVSLKLVQEHANNMVLAGELAQVYAAVDQGSRLEVPLRQCTVFPPTAVDIMAVGEEAGQLDTVLFRLAESYKNEVDHSVSVFSSLLEPCLLLCMGLFVALIVWAVYLPYFSLPGLL